MKISEDIKLDFDDVLIKPKRSTLESRANVNVVRDFVSFHSKQKISGFPLIVANMDTVGTIPMLKTMVKNKSFVALHKYHTIEQLKSVKEYADNLFVTIGESQEELDNLSINNVYPKMLLIDAANAYREKFVTALKRARNRFPDSIIMAGNVATPEMTEQLILSGADIVKCGIGPGSLCETRKKTGVGFPQLSCILECKDAAHGIGGLICADGGIKNAGDAAKAFGAGADFIMTGSLFMGCDECEGEWTYTEYTTEYRIREYTKEDIAENSPLVTYLGISCGTDEQSSIPAGVHICKELFVVNSPNSKKKTLKVYGMSSHAAQKKYLGEIQKHRASEGKEHIVPYKGMAEDVLNDIVGGVVSACSYSGARSLKDFDKCCSFIRVARTHQSIF